MKKATNTHLLLLILFFTSCGQEEKIVHWPPHKNEERSSEVIGNDTFNRVEYGYKQGKWYVIDSAIFRQGKYGSAVTDTVYYRNDTILE